MGWFGMKQASLVGVISWNCEYIFLKYLPIFAWVVNINKQNNLSNITKKHFTQFLELFLISIVFMHI